jgi:hypothetical protein
LCVFAAAATQVILPLSLIACWLAGWLASPRTLTLHNFSSYFTIASSKLTFLATSSLILSTPK